jgi:hypothetical protein
MANSIQARLDDETESMRERLKATTGWTDSEIIRRGIKLLAAVTPAKARKGRFTGVGKYDSGIPDLATNPKHMEGFGES